MSGALLALRAIHFAYAPDRPVLRGADLALGAGERLAVAGPNGAGKSTLLRLAVGLLTPQAGTVEAFGRPCASEEDFQAMRPRAGLVFQDPDDQLFCPTVAEDVAFGPLNQGLKRDAVRARVAETLDMLGLAGFTERITHHLSGGEKRLVSLATVLAMKPDVLLLDEPTNALDAATRDRLITILAGLPQAMILISHDGDFLDQLATRRVALVDGKISS